MITNTSQLYRVPLLPGRPNVFPVTGRHFFVVSAPVTLKVKIGEMVTNDFVASQGVSFDAPEYFENIEITHSEAVAIEVELWIGAVAFIDNRRDNIESPTVCVGWTGTELAAAPDAGSTVTFTPAFTGGKIRRKAVVVANYDAALTVNICDPAGNIVSPVRPNETITLPISAAFKLINPNGAPVSCSVGEIYWTR